MDSKALADLIAADLESVVARTRVAYLQRIPRLRALPPDALDEVVEATRRAMELFCRYYLEGTLDPEAWARARDATIERAGEVFSHAEIVDIIDIARAVGGQTVDELAARHPELSAEERARVVTAMDRYVAELAEEQDRLRLLASPTRLDDVLYDLEREGADLQ